METWKVFLMNRNTAKSDWFTCPIQIEEVKEVLEIEHENDFELVSAVFPFEIDKWCSIEEINRYCEYLKELPNWILEDMKLFKKYLDLDGTVEWYTSNKIKLYQGYYDLEDVKKEFGLTERSDYFLSKLGIVELKDFF